MFVQPIGSPAEARQITPWSMNCQDRPTFSPDGGLVLFRCLPKGEEGPSNLYWAHPDGTDPHKITHAPAEKQYLGSSFSPASVKRAAGSPRGALPGRGGGQR